MNEDLKWLAENVHEWPDGFCAIQKDDYWSYEFLHGSNPEHYIGIGEMCFTRAQWQAARDELSGKPSWDDVVGEWIAQDEDGHWYSFDCQPRRSDRCWHNSPCHREGPGKVLGDWRNTLERRPCVSESAKSYTQEDLSVVGDKQWRGPDDGFPPTGTECEVRYFGKYNNNWFRIKITAVTDTFVIGYIREDWESCIKKSDPYVCFRPLHTEEDKAVEEMKELIKGACWDEDICRRLYRAGYRKQEQK